MTSRPHKYLFGPVPSRRLGRSLGLDPVPFKTCTYDCIYCQLGRTTARTLERREYVPVHEVLSELDRRLSEGVTPDYVTLTGSGEPTLHSRLNELIAGIKRRTRIPVAVLTNGSLLWDAAVRRDLADADVVIPSLDAGDERLFQYVNRPHPDLSFERMLEGLRAFRREFTGRLWLEVLLLEGVTDIQAEVEKIAKWAEEISPDRIQLTTVTRPPAEGFALPVSADRMRRLAKTFPAPAEVIADRNEFGPFSTRGIQDEDVLGLLRRRPCTVRDIAQGMGLQPSEVVKRLHILSRRGDVLAKRKEGEVFYSAGPADMERYHQSCGSKFWQDVFRAEVDYLVKRLEGTREVLSVGCGPAVIESALHERGFRVTGLDVSREALDHAPGNLRTVLAPAENMPFPKSSFDAVLFVASLQFIADYRKAIAEAARVLRPDGKVIVMLLNPRSAFFKERAGDPGSYVSRVRHTDLTAIEEVIAERFAVQTEYFLGVKDRDIFDSSDDVEAALYVVVGRMRAAA